MKPAPTARPRLRTCARWLTAACAALAAGCVQVDPVSPSAFPPPPTGATEALYVSASAVDGDGTETKPYGSIQQAVDIAKEGAAILVAKGAYAEALVVDRGLTILGVGDQGAVTIADANVSVLVRVRDTESPVLFENLTLHGGQAAVVVVASGEVTMRRVHVEGVATDDLSPGYGVVVKNGVRLTFEDGTVTGCDSVGISVRDASIDLRRSTIQSNTGGGVRLEGASDVNVIADSLLEDNEIFGLASFSSVVTITGSTVTKTRGVGDSGDGVVASLLPEGDPLRSRAAGLFLGTKVPGEGNQVTWNARMGVLVDGPVQAFLISNDVRSNSLGGIWALHGDTSTQVAVLDNEVTDNQHVGIGIASAAWAAVVENRVYNTIRDEMLGTLSHGDGIYIGSNGIAQVSSNTSTGNERYGIFFDGVHLGSCLAMDNEVEGNGDGKAHGWHWQPEAAFRECEDTAPGSDPSAFAKADCLAQCDYGDEACADACGDLDRVPVVDDLTCTSMECVQDPAYEGCPDCGAVVGYTRSESSLACDHEACLEDADAPGCPGSDQCVDSSESCYGTDAYSTPDDDLPD